MRGRGWRVAAILLVFPALASCIAFGRREPPKVCGSDMTGRHQWAWICGEPNGRMCLNCEYFWDDEDLDPRRHCEKEVETR